MRIAKRKWTPAEDAKLLAFVDQGFDHAAIAKTMSRSAKAISIRASKLRCRKDRAPLQGELIAPEKPRVRVETSEVKTDPMIARLIAEIKMYKQIVASQAATIQQITTGA